MAGWSLDTRSQVTPWPASTGQALASLANLPDNLQVQVFGRRDSRATQKALRFFSDRRITVAFVDLARKPIAAGELRRFAQKFGARALFDTNSKQYVDSGLSYLSMDEDAAFDRLLADERLLLLPLVRAGTQMFVGIDEDSWRGWLATQDDG